MNRFEKNHTYICSPSKKRNDSLAQLVRATDS
jgi:hypothetical protein